MFTCERIEHPAVLGSHFLALLRHYAVDTAPADFTTQCVSASAGAWTTGEILVGRKHAAFQMSRTRNIVASFV
ncbi:MAG: hypothetical protein CMM00_13865 [Rhodopirellula sp.]|uniref:Uncharacterized protein n=1 Tax=Rhodopirellula bahusiensis TaxID=2014065 RepID=A0A2G1W7H1_9BACT|nr:hypothetical protein [Rhodopirellula sp.]PHQ34985.1 hypothetical protein CEE69_11135 [Rhodopirellula bahusiensis]